MAYEFPEGGNGLVPGTYVLDFASIAGAQQFPTLAIKFTVPSGWDKVMIDGLVWNDAGVRLGLDVVDNVYVDPCDAGRGVRTPPVGPSVDDLARALANVPGWEMQEADHDVYFGFPGIRLVLKAPADMSACTFEESRLAHTLGFPGFMTGIAGGEHELWILSVAGTRLVVAAMTAPDASADARQELRAVVDSIQIQP